MKNALKKRFALTDQGAKDLIKASFASFLVYLINMTPAIVLLSFVDQLILDNPKGGKFYILSSLSMLVLMYILLAYEYDALYNATYKESANLRIDIAERLGKLPLSYFSSHNLSDLSQTIMKDVEAIEHAMSHAMGKTIGFLIFFPLVSLAMILGNYKLALAVILPVALNIVLMLISKKIQVKNIKKHYLVLRENSESFQETIEMGQDIKSFGMTAKVKEDLYRKMDEGERLQLRSNIIQVIPVVLGGMLMFLSIAIVILVGSKLYIDGQISVLYLVAYLLSAMKLREAVEGVSQNIAEIFYLDERINRIKEIKEAKIQSGQDFNIESFDIELENVAFSYDENSKVLEDVSFKARQGEVTALVGLSGCGKTSILKLVSRLYDYDEGEIRIDGRDIKDISTDCLFKKISIVFQDVTLFNSSILENIRIGRSDASDAEVKEAARLANCQEFIEKLEDGYDTLIGENGASLSGGERQRLSIARAFLKDAPILILDEISSSLDVENEKKIQESLNRLMKNKTVIIISHRLNSIENVDQIVVLNNGRVEASGSHKDLLLKSASYNNLVGKARLAEEFRY